MIREYRLFSQTLARISAAESDGEGEIEGPGAPFFVAVGSTSDLNSVPAARSTAWVSSGRRTRIVTEGRDEIILNGIQNLLDEIQVLYFE